MSKLKTLYFGILFLLASNAFSQDYDQLIDSLFISSEEQVIPGFSISIVQSDSVVSQKSYGYANVKKEVKFDADTKFAIASCSKQFTAYCILLLEQENKINLTDDVRKYIPELPNYSSTVQIKHLLSHTSGIRDHIVMLGWCKNQKEKYYNFEGTLKALEKYNGLSFKPGDRFAYSNTGYVLLALIVERVSGIAFEDFAQQNIFTLLKMSNTEFSFRRKFEEVGSVNPYSYNSETKKYKEFKHLEVNALGATGIYTTISDFTKWDIHLSNPSRDRKSIIEKMFIADTLNNGRTVNYNFGFKHRIYNGYKVIEHAGGWANYNFQYTRIPKLNLSLIIASNNDNHYPIGMADNLIEVIVPKSKKIPQGKSTDQPELLAAYYFCEDFTSVRIVEDEGHYSLCGDDLYLSKKYPLISNGEELLDSAGNHFEFHSKDSTFYWYGGSYFNFPRKFTPNLPIEKRKAPNYSGVYYSEELGELKIKYRRRKDEFRIKTSFGKNPKISSIKNRLIKTDKGYNIFLVKENQVLLGNSRVCVRFDKQ